MVDITRRVYERRAKLFSDSSATVTIQWYRCKPDAKPLGRPTTINMNIWTWEPWRRDGIGEVYSDVPKFVRVDTPVSATGQKPCSPSETYWIEGEHYNPSGEGSARDGFGLLMCCNNPIFIGPAMIEVIPDAFINF